MEANRILHATLGGLIAALLVSGLGAQEAPPDTTRPIESPPADTIRFTPPVLPDTLIPDTLTPPLPSIDTTATGMDTAAATEWRLAIDTLSISVYQAHGLIAVGPPDEVKDTPTYFISQPGPVGSPALPFEYLNAAGAEVRLNGLPFPYNGIYRPYVIGTDLNAIPWEIMNGIEAAPHDCCYPGLNFIVGPPADRVNRSDIELSRGPYGYSGTRWRFFRPFNKKTYAYFTLGFKKSDGFIAGADFNGHHATGGIARRMAGGEISVDLWTHRARTGLLAFDFLTPQEMRQSRTLNRIETRYGRPIAAQIYLNLTGLYQRTDQTVTGFASRQSTKYDLGGGEALLTDSLRGATVSLAADFYRLLLFGLTSGRPEANQVSARLGIDNGEANLTYAFNLSYAWNKIDESALLPSARISYDFGRFKPYLFTFRARSLPDLYIRNFRDHIPSAGAPDAVNSYTFTPDPDINTPLVTQLSVGADIGNGRPGIDLGVSYKRIDSQVYARYTIDAARNITVSPENFDDSYIDLFGTGRAALWIFEGDLGGSLKFWDDERFPDGIEKGPKAQAFGRLAFRREIFVPRLFVGGSLEGHFASRRDFRGVFGGSEGAYFAFDGRLEFQYKDFTFWLNDENLTNESYFTWWPYYEAPRIVWWGLRWNFFD